MPTPNEVFATIDRLAAQQPDPADSAYEIKEHLDALLSEPIHWPLALQRAMDSPEVVLPIAVAWCLAEDGARDAPQTGWAQLLQFLKGQSRSHPNFLHMALVAIENRVRTHPEDLPPSKSRQELLAILLEYGKQAAGNKLIVSCSWLATLEAILVEIAWRPWLDDAARAALSQQLRGFLPDLDGAFEDQAHRLLGRMGSWS